MQVKHRRALLAVGIPLAVLLTAGAAERTLRHQEGQWVDAVREDLIIGVEVTGTLAAVESSQLGPPPIGNIWDYKIAQIAPEGSQVKRGQPVVGFDTTRLQQELREKTAEADSASKQLEKTEADLLLNRETERLRLAEAEARLRKAIMKLESPGEVVASNERQKAQLEQDLAQRETRFLTAKLRTLESAARKETELLRGRLTRAERRVEEIRQQIDAMSVRAPRDGTVVYLTNWRSEKKKVGDSVWRGERVVEIPDLRLMKAKGEVDEVDAGKIQLKQRAILRLDAHPDEELHGQINWIANTVQRQTPHKPLKVLRLEMTLQRTDPEKMRPGMRFRGEIEIDRVADAVLVPADAVVNTARGPVLIRKRLFGSDETAVRLGKRNEKQVQVLDGISAGDQVLVRTKGDRESGS